MLANFVTSRAPFTSLKVLSDAHDCKLTCCNKLICTDFKLDMYQTLFMSQFSRLAKPIMCKNVESIQTLKLTTHFQDKSGIGKSINHPANACTFSFRCS